MRCIELGSDSNFIRTAKFESDPNSAEIDLKRTDYCGRIDRRYLDQTIALCGWVHRRRDHGAEHHDQLEDVLFRERVKTQVNRGT